MSGARALAAAGVAAGGLATLAHAGPAVTWLPPVRRRVAPAWHGLGRPGHVALTFDDGPDPTSTPAFLAALDGLGWRATFFMLGSMAERSPGLAGEVAAAGHEIALHGHEHRNQLARTPAGVAADLARGLDAVASASGHQPVWHRPPYGVVSGPGWRAARELGLRIVLWSAWGRDWRARAMPASVVADVEAGLTPGATILLHDSDCTSAPGAWRSALGALPLLAERLVARGWDVGPLAEHGVGSRSPR
ncbi:MAG: polysaccharide deacetylase family protein [Acidimicrobiales bacterium]